MKSKSATKRALLSSAVSLVLCFTMLLGTTFAWFTDSASTGVNTINSGTLDVALQDASGNSLEGKSFAFKNTKGESAILWEPGVTFVTDGFKVVNNGNLALKYKVAVNGVSDGSTAKLLEVIDFYVTTISPAGYATGSAYEKDVIDGAKDIPATTVSLYDFVSEYKELLPTNSSDTFYLVGHMQEEAGNEYQDLKIEGVGLTVYATQLESEFDSFDNKYDNDAPLYDEEALPVAYIAPLSGSELNIDVTGLTGVDNITLDAGYQFLPTEEYDEVGDSKYRKWHADFVVSADQDIPANAIALAGYYSLYCDGFNNGKWVALTSTDAITKGTEIRLLKDGLNVPVNYEEICMFGNDGIGFKCGIYAPDPSVVAGTTVNIDLRLYETEEPSASNGNSTNVEVTPENYVVIGTYSYTFPVEPVAAATQTELNDAIANSASDVIAVELAAGEYTIPDSAQGKTLTIVGEEGTVIGVVDDGAAEGDIDYSLDGSNVTFENVTLNIQGSNYPGYARMSATYNNCTIVGSNYTLYGNSVFNNCTFNLNNGYVWTWGAPSVEFNNCTFEDTVGGKAKAILVHNTVETVVTVKDCTFIATTSAETWDGIPVAAVSIDPENGSPDATVKFVGTNTYSNAFYALYQVKYADEVDDVTVIVDGEEVTLTAMK